MHNPKLPCFDSLLTSGINEQHVTISLTLGTAELHVFAMEFEPELVPSVVTALNVNLAEVKRIWPDKVKATFARLVSQSVSPAVSKDGTLTLLFVLDGGSELAVRLEPDNPAELGRTFKKLSQILSQRRH